MNILGDKEQFAIQWNCESLNDKWFPTQICFWIGGKQIGNFEDTLQMYYYITRLEDFLLYEKIRFHPFLFNRSKEDIFNHIYQRAYEFIINDMKDKDEIFDLDLEPYDQYFLEEEYQQWLKRVFTIGDMFFPAFQDYAFMIINEPTNNLQRLIWLDLSQPKFTINEFTLPIGYFEGVAWEFLKQSIEYLKNNGCDISYFDKEREQDW